MSNMHCFYDGHGNLLDQEKDNYDNLEENKHHDQRIVVIRGTWVHDVFHHIVFSWISKSN